MIATEEASTPEEAGKKKKKKVAVNIFWLKITNVVQVTMEKMIKMQKARKEEKPVAMLIKGGMLFKDGKTTEEKKVGLPFSFFELFLFLFQAEDMGMSVKEMITMTEGLTKKEVGFRGKRVVYCEPFAKCNI